MQWFTFIANSIFIPSYPRPDHQSVDFPKQPRYPGYSISSNQR